MPLFTKPQFNSVWASTGTKLSPIPAKISQGWIVEIPPYEYDNWLQGRQDQLLAHINQVGIPMWDATVEYQAGKSYIQGTTTGVVYRAVTTNTNVNPELDIQGNWTVAFEATGQALLKANNLSDVPDKALARENLGIATTPFYDGRYLARDSNLADVPNKASARNNLGLGGAAVLGVGATAGTVAAGNDARIVNAVQNSRRVNSGAGLSGGGLLDTDVNLVLGTPSPVTATSSNYASGATHSHSIDVGSFMPNYWADVTSQRVSGATYVNTTGKIMFVAATSGASDYQTDIVFTVNGMEIYRTGADMAGVGGRSGGQIMVPVGASYSIWSNLGIHSWMESR